MPVPPGLSPKDADQVLRAVMDDSNNRLRVDAEITAVITDLDIRAATGDNIAITNQDGTNPLVIEPDGSINTNATIVGGELAVEISAADGDNIAISDGTNTVSVNTDGSINVELNGLNQFQTNSYTVGTSAIQIAAVPLVDRSSIGFKAICSGSNAVYIGNSSGVTTSTGWPLMNNDTLELDLTPGQQIWAIASAINQSLFIIELGA